MPFLQVAFMFCTHIASLWQHLQEAADGRMTTVHDDVLRVDFAKLLNNDVRDGN
jgi:hypothetical protein